MSHDRYMMLTGLGHALRCDPESRVRGIVPDSDPDGFEAVTILYTNGGSKTVNVTGDSCVAIMQDVAKALL